MHRHLSGVACVTHAVACSRGLLMLALVERRALPL